MKKAAKERKKVEKTFPPHSFLVRSLFSFRAALSLTLRPTIDSKHTEKPPLTQATIDRIFAIVYEEFFFSISSLRLLSFFFPTIAAIIKSWESLK